MSQGESELTVCFLERSPGESQLGSPKTAGWALPSSRRGWYRVHLETFQTARNISPTESSRRKMTRTGRLHSLVRPMMPIVLRLVWTETPPLYSSMFRPPTPMESQNLRITTKERCTQWSTQTSNHPWKMKKKKAGKPGWAGAMTGRMTITNSANMNFRDVNAAA